MNGPINIREMVESRNKIKLSKMNSILKEERMLKNMERNEQH